MATAPVLAKVSAGNLALPADMQQALGLIGDGYLLVSVQDGQLRAEPMKVNELDSESLCAEFEDLRQLTGSMPELRGAVEELIAERTQARW